ncbi:hypothetical protein B0H13DRAFT_2399744 [Mycena leptocephala]|nr:hypothetical protein B0H13DRAFT_2399744 [Mycena leptocephala]
MDALTPAVSLITQKLNLLQPNAPLHLACSSLSLNRDSHSACPCTPHGATAVHRHLGLHYRRTLRNATFLTAPRPSPAQIAAALARINGTPSIEESARARRDLGLTQTEILFDLQDSYHVEVEWQFPTSPQLVEVAARARAPATHPNSIYGSTYTPVTTNPRLAYLTSPELFVADPSIACSSEYDITADTLGEKLDGKQYSACSGILTVSYGSNHYTGNVETTVCLLGTCSSALSTPHTRVLPFSDDTSYFLYWVTSNEVCDGSSDPETCTCSDNCGPF